MKMPIFLVSKGKKTVILHKVGVRVAKRPDKIVMGWLDLEIIKITLVGV